LTASHGEFLVRPDPPPHPPGARTVAAGGYEIIVGAGLLGGIGPFVRSVLPNAGRALLVHDSALPRAYIDSTAAALGSAGFSVAACPVRATEDRKSLTTLEQIFGAAVSARLERDEPIIALGGGIVGDVAGFAAATYRRGVPIIHLPTTLLSMVDASVGGKTAVNIRSAGPNGALSKNMAGAFHRPSLVVCDVSTLHSLPDRELRSGLAECIKHALIGADFADPTLTEFIEQHRSAILARDEATLIKLVARNVTIKANCVARDEFERRHDDSPHGGRMALNCGHTVAHAIETLPGLLHGAGDTGDTGLTHGEAVGLGLLAECVIATHMALNDAGAITRLETLLARAGLPTRVRGLPATSTIIDRMLDDKKVAGGKLRLALPAADNRCRLVTDPPMGAVAAGIEAIRA